VEELLQILESGEYRPPMQKDFDSTIIVDHLWEVHRDEFDAATRLRLGALVGSPVLCASASRHLEVYLLALAGIEPRFGRSGVGGGRVAPILATPSCSWTALRTCKFVTRRSSTT
jgi:hypothetical protein